MNRFLKIFALLIFSLFLVVSGVDAGLDQLSHSVSQNSYTLYDGKNEPVITYSGDLRLCKTYIKRNTVSEFHLLHRG